MTKYRFLFFIFNFKMNFEQKCEWSSEQLSTEATICHDVYNKINIMGIKCLRLNMPNNSSQGNSANQKCYEHSSSLSNIWINLCLINYNNYNNKLYTAKTIIPNITNILHEIHNEQLHLYIIWYPLSIIHSICSPGKRYFI